MTAANDDYILPPLLEAFASFSGALCSDGEHEASIGNRIVNEAALQFATVELFFLFRTFLAFLWKGLY